METASPLPLNFFEKDTKRVAQSLLGKVISYQSPRYKERLTARIVETEAYLGLKDPAAHSFHGKITKRTEVFYKPGGHIYVYLIYGMYHCLNFITRNEKHPEAVLIRALEPLQGKEAMLKAENKTRDTDILNGPGKLCRAMAIDFKLNAKTVLGPEMLVFDDGFKVQKKNIVSTSRIGIGYAGEAALWPLRYYISGSPYISKK